MSTENDAGWRSVLAERSGDPLPTLAALETLGLRCVGFHDWEGTDRPGTPLFVFDTFDELRNKESAS